MTSPVPPAPGLPAAQGLYDPAFEHDACGVAFVVDQHGRRSHELVEQGITALVNLDHRGASGAEVNTGDGAGILIQIPDGFYREVVGFDLPDVGRYATGIAFLPGSGTEVDDAVDAIAKIVVSEGLEVLGWRDVPVVPDGLGQGALGAIPTFRQLFLAGPGGALLPEPVVSHGGLQGHAHHASAARLLPRPGRPAGGERHRPGALALLHQHLPFVAAGPPVPLPGPQRRDQHGAGQPQLDARPRGAARQRPVPGDIDRLFPICTPGGSDSASFDEVLELLHLGGRPLPTPC
jgi:glutamate synthase (NADPH/NADH) large chain